MSNHLIQHNLARAADIAPQGIACKFLDTSLTYARFESKTNQLARLMLDLGVGRGHRVGIMTGRRLEVPIAVYAALKTGAAFIPLDPDMAFERLRELMTTCEIDVIISEQRMQVKLEQLAVTRTKPLHFIDCSDAESLVSAQSQLHCVVWSTIDQFSTLPVPEVNMRSSDDAYIMFTSGSTGVPKGIVHTHSSANAYARLTVDHYAITRHDVLGAHSPLHFDMSTMAFLSMPMAAGTAVIIPDVYTRLPASMSKIMQDDGITIWYSVPYAIIQLISRGALEARNLEKLRWVLYGGEPFSPHHIRKLMDSLPKVRVSNVYGPAETNQCTHYTVPGSLRGDEDAVPIGTFWDEARALIIDANDTPVEQGQLGELLVHSPATMKGYFRQPELNLKCFYEKIDHGQPTIYYRTGDLATLGDDGLYYYSGRVDQQVKIRGNRIEINEIENIVLAHPGVQEAVAYAVDRGSENERLNVSVILSGERSFDEVSLRAVLASSVPPFAMPDRITVRPEFPRTTSGKVDRRLLSMQERIE
jgi:amino acid adenylation domain-containing protein